MVMGKHSCPRWGF